MLNIKETFEKYYRFGHTNMIGPRPLGGGAPGGPPWIR